MEKKMYTQNKRFTREDIARKLVYGSGLQIFVGIFLCCSGVSGWLMLLGGMAAGIPLLALGGLLVGSVLTCCGVCVIKKSRERKKKIMQGNYRIIATTCCSVERETNEEYPWWAHEFSNGAVFRRGFKLAEKGNLCYLIYPEGEKYPKICYNSVIYKPEDDLKIEYFE